MTELLFENPILLGVTGGAFTLIALVVWIKAGHSAALYAALSLLLLTIALVVLNIQIQTDREKVQGVMSDVASAVKRNDLNGVLAHLHQNPSPTLARAKTELRTFKFTEARITGIKKVEINNDTNPASAIAEFNVMVSATGRGLIHEHAAAFIRCYFLKESSRWLVSDYELHDPTYGFKIENQR